MTTSDKVAIFALAAIAAGAIAYRKGFRVLLKDGVILALRPELASRLQDIEQVHIETVNRGMIVTAGSEGEDGDGVHKSGSLHYKGLAIDVRTRDLTSAQITALVARLKAVLGSKFDVVLEKDHIHIEYDPK